MSIFRCKMCGGTIEFEPGATVGVCDSCGTKQTLPKTSLAVLAFNAVAVIKSGAPPKPLQGLTKR